jgi:signal recognition particle GTPase
MNNGRLNSVYVTSNEANLQLSITALKSLISEYAMRATQSEQLCNTLLNEKMDDLAMQAIVQSLISEHSENRSKERAVHQQAVLQSLLIALTQLKNVDDLETIHKQVNSIVQSLTLSLADMNPSK